MHIVCTVGYNHNMTTVSSQVYYDPSHAKREGVLFEGWILAALSGQLPNPSMVWVADVQSQTILLVRGEDGIVRAFENSCLHRGTQIYPPKTGRHAWKGEPISAVTCGYHGWKYTDRGAIQHIPKAKGIQCTETHLKQYAVFEDAGFIWVSLETPRIDAASLFAPIHDAVRHYHLEEMEPIEARDFHFPVNWKVSLENALDYYHVSTVHPKTVGAHVDAEPTFRDLGWHSLQTLYIAPYGWREKLDNHCARKRPYSDHELSSLHKYFVFPNLVINVLPYHLTVMQFFPNGPTDCIMRYRFCQRQKPGKIERARVWASWVASRYILYEDVRIYTQIQQGMEKSTQTEHPLHEQERGVEHFHDALNRWIDDTQPASET